MAKIIEYDELQLGNYLRDLAIVGSLSSLFSDSSIPLLHYRVTENLYCSSFDAENLARADVTADAKLHTYGVGIKTFTEGNKKTFQKVAEFNNQQALYEKLEPVEKVKKIAELRNKRIDFTKSAYDIKSMIYHCIIRNRHGFHLFEEEMNSIDISKIKLISCKGHIYRFTDEKEIYQFNASKSTLYKEFKTTDYFAEIGVKILDNPMEELRRLDLKALEATIHEYLILPLYTYEKGTSNKIVPQRSGLNQWNANGRRRNQDEVYIPFQADVRAMFESYFPDRNTPFDVQLPNGKILSMKICQSDGKAIMSNPNKALGEWILRDILKIPYGQLVTYDMLLEIGIDSIIFDKVGDTYKLDFTELGSFEDFVINKVLPDYK